MNGYGEHNIQGIGDKHIPLIHNVMNTDFVDRRLGSQSPTRSTCCSTTRSAAAISPSGGSSIRRWSRQFDDIGISGIANIVAAIKLAKHLDLRRRRRHHDGRHRQRGALWQRARRATAQRRYPGGFDEVNAGEIFGRHLTAIADDHVIELTHVDRKRIFNLGYYTWVEQQGVIVEDFDRRKDQSFWHGLADSRSRRGTS